MTSKGTLIFEELCLNEEGLAKLTYEEYRTLFFDEKKKLETHTDDERRKIFAKFGFAIRSQQALEFYKELASEYHYKINGGSMPFLEALLRSPLSDKEVMPESYNFDDKCRLQIAALAP